MWTKSFAALLLCMLFAGTIAACTACLLPTPGARVNVPGLDFDRYWSQLEHNWPRWFTGQCIPVPKLPHREELRARLKFFEVPWDVMQREGNHCTYSNWKIRVGTDQWACVPHELGHAACDLLGRPEGCEEYEHFELKECMTEVEAFKAEGDSGVYSTDDEIHYYCNGEYVMTLPSCPQGVGF